MAGSAAGKHLPEHGAHQAAYLVSVGRLLAPAASPPGCRAEAFPNPGEKSHVLTENPRRAAHRAQLKGQGSSAAWNPYAVAGRFVVNQIESSSSVDALARKIVAQILTQRS